MLSSPIRVVESHTALRFHNQTLIGWEEKHLRLSFTKWEYHITGHQEMICNLAWNSRLGRTLKSNLEAFCLGVTQSGEFGGSGCCRLNKVASHPTTLLGVLDSGLES